MICGQEDNGTTPAQPKEIAGSVSGASLELIPESAYLANIEQSEVFNTLLLSYMKADNKSDQSKKTSYLNILVSASSLVNKGCFSVATKSMGYDMLGLGLQISEGLKD